MRPAAGCDAASSDTNYTKIMPVKVLAADGSGSTSTVANGVTWAADHGAAEHADDRDIRREQPVQDARRRSHAFT